MDDRCFENTGVRVENKNSGRWGIVLWEYKSTGQVCVLENIAPCVINTHDSWKTLKIIDR